MWQQWLQAGDALVTASANHPTVVGMLICFPVKIVAGGPWQNLARTWLFQVLSLPASTQLLQLTRLDLAGLMLQSGSRAAVEQICELSALQSLQLGHSNILCSSLR